MSYKGIKAPTSHRITNPLKKKSNSSARKQHAKILAAGGTREPKSPC